MGKTKKKFVKYWNFLPNFPQTYISLQNNKIICYSSHHQATYKKRARFTRQKAESSIRMRTDVCGDTDSIISLALL